MDASDLESLPPPPGVVSSLRGGFDAIASHVAAILLPLVLDLWLWLGPHLSMEHLFMPVLAEFRQMARSNGIPTAEVNRALDIYGTLFREFNLFSVLRTFPIGISSLMTGRMPMENPLGVSTIWQVGTGGSLFLIIIGLTFAGWLAGGMYFHWIATLVNSGQEEQLESLRAITQTIFFSILWAIVTMILGLPVMLIMYLLFAISPSLAQGVLLFLGFLSMWLVVPLFFAPHGMFLRKQNTFTSILGGLRMARFTLPASSMFVLSVFLLGIGLNFLWSVPPVDSWMALVGIFGHAFVTTALLASSFVYYRDMTAWLQIVMDRYKSTPAARQV